MIVLDPRLIGEKGGRPDLAVGVWIGATHYGTLILKYLNPSKPRTQLQHLLHPSAKSKRMLSTQKIRKEEVHLLIHDSSDILVTHNWEGKIGVGMKTHDTTSPMGWGSLEEVSIW